MICPTLRPAISLLCRGIFNRRLVPYLGLLCIPFTDMVCFARRQGRLCIYELMSEESAVNYWEVRDIYFTSYRHRAMHFRHISALIVYAHIAFLPV